MIMVAMAMTVMTMMMMTFSQWTKMTMMMGSIKIFKGFNLHKVLVILTMPPLCR